MCVHSLHRFSPNFGKLQPNVLSKESVIVIEIVVVSILRNPSPNMSKMHGYVVEVVREGLVHTPNM